MKSYAPSSTGHLWRDALAQARYRMTHPDWPAWRRFLLALFALSLSFFLALFSGVLNHTGRHVHLCPVIIFTKLCNQLPFF